MTEKLIEVKDLKKYYNGGEVKARDGSSVDICKGDVIAVIGPSGGGSRPARAESGRPGLCRG